MTESPEVTGSASNVPSSTSSYQSTVVRGTTSPKSSFKSNSNSGATTGSEVGGVVVVALIAGLAAWFTIRRRRRRRHAPSADYISSQGSDIAAVPYPMDLVRPKLYVRLFFFFRSATCQGKAYETVIDRIVVSAGSFRPKHIPDAANFSDDLSVGLE